MGSIIIISSHCVLSGQDVNDLPELGHTSIFPNRLNGLYRQTLNETPPHTVRKVKLASVGLWYAKISIEGNSHQEVPIYIPQKVTDLDLSNNELANLAERLGADIEYVRRGTGYEKTQPARLDNLPNEVRRHGGFQRWPARPQQRGRVRHHVAADGGDRGDRSALRPQHG